jgi:competence protein ComEC
MSSSGVAAWQGSAVASATRVRRAPLLLAGWLVANLQGERGRWPLWLPVFLGAGIGAYFWLRFEPSPWIAPAGMAAGIAACLGAWRVSRFAAMALPGAAVATLFFGFGLAQFQTWRVAAPVLRERVGPIRVEGRLVSAETLTQGIRLTLAPRSIEGLAADEMPALVRINVRTGADDFRPGEWLSLRAVLMPPPGPAMPGGYDFQRRAWFDRLGAVGYARGPPRQIPYPDGARIGRWRATIEATRTAVTARIHAALPGPSGAIAAALIAGETHAIPPADASAFRDAGLAHILVIAGLHMGMVAGIVFFGVRAFLALIPVIALRFSTKIWAAAAALAVTFFYLLLSGATVSSRRAFIMIGLMLLGVLLDRVTLSARTLACAAVAIMLLAPESTTGPSFQMSFAAVAGLVACYEALRPRLVQFHVQAGTGRRIALYLLGIALTTVVTTLATMPFTIYHFNRFPIYSIAANIAVVPITGFWIMPWAIVATILMPLHLEAVALAPMGWGIMTASAIAHAVTALPDSVLRVGSMPPLGLIMLAVGGLWLCLWQRRWRLIGLVPMAAGYATLLFIAPPDILIAGDGQLVAVRAADGGYMPSDLGGDPWTEENWTQHEGVALDAAWPRHGASSDSRLSCDGDDCVYRMRGMTVAIVRRGTSIGRACDTADLVISPAAAEDCEGARLIDGIATRQRGGHAVWLAPDGILIESVADWRGHRPWIPDQVPRRFRLRLSSAASDR